MPRPEIEERERRPVKVAGMTMHVAVRTPGSESDDVRVVGPFPDAVSATGYALRQKSLDPRGTWRVAVLEDVEDA